jgi:hypothetical protein
MLKVLQKIPNLSDKSLCIRLEGILVLKKGKKEKKICFPKVYLKELL